MNPKLAIDLADLSKVKNLCNCQSKPLNSKILVIYDIMEMAMAIPVTELPPRNALALLDCDKRKNPSLGAVYEVFDGGCKKPKFFNLQKGGSLVLNEFAAWAGLDK